MSNIVRPDLQQIPLEDLQGLSQRQDMDKIPDNYSPLMMNIDLSQTGSWNKRNGAKLFSGSSRVGSVNALIEYTAATASSTKTIHSFRGVSLVSTIAENYNTDTDTYTTIDGSTLVKNELLSTTNFIGKVYVTGPNTLLASEGGGTLTTHTSQIMASSIAVAQNTLFVANVTSLGGVAVNYQDRAYYSIADSANNLPSDVFVNAGDADIAHSTRFFSINAPIVGIFPYATGGMGVAMIYAFSKRRCYNWNMRYLDNNTGPVEMFNIGLININAICSCMGVMIWMDNRGKLWSWAGFGLPDPISWDIEDDTKKEAIINLIDKTQKQFISMGAIGNKFYVSIGAITYKGVTIPNAILTGVVSKSRQVVIFSLEAYPVRPSVFANVEINGEEVLLFGSSTTADVYQINSGTNDGGIAISAFGITKFINFGLPFSNKLFAKIYIEYRPQPVAGTYLKVSYALNNSTVYTVLSDPANNITNAGIIDMNKGYSANVYSAAGFLFFPGSVTGQSISIKVENNVIDQTFEIRKLRFDFTVDPPNYNVN